MEFANRVCRTLHDEHDRTIELIERLELALDRMRGGSPPGVGEPGTARLLADLKTWVETEITRHFGFEEERLFDYLASHGNAALGESLSEEHRVIVPLGVRLAALARKASGAPLAAAEWDEFRRSGRQLCELIRAHVQKEELALLPTLEDEMDSDTEARLYQDYVETM